MNKLNSKQNLAMALAYHCVRNCGFLEVLHEGPHPWNLSKTGDYSDVKVVGPNGEIPWLNVSRITDEEMKQLMTNVTDALYTAFIHPYSIAEHDVPSYWNAPKDLLAIPVD